MKCQGNGLQVRVGDLWIFCGVSDENKIVQVGNGWHGEIVCPSYKTICGGSGYPLVERSTCPFPSSWQNGRCVCAPGRMNEDCTVEDTLASRSLYPYGLQYASAELVLQATVPFPQALPATPTILGNLAGLRFSVNPPLPAGLSLSPSDGVIRGMALNASQRSAYTIRAAAGQGAATTTLFLTALCPPSNASCVPNAPTAFPTEYTSTTIPPSSPPGSPVDQTSPTGTVGPLLQITTTSKGSNLDQVEKEAWPFHEVWFQVSVAICIACFSLTIVCALLCACRRKQAERHIDSTLHIAPVQPGARARRAQRSEHKPLSPSRARSPHSNSRRPQTVHGVMPTSPCRDVCVAQMLEMGYDFDAALSALEHTAWDVHRAVAEVQREQQIHAQV